MKILVAHKNPTIRHHIIQLLEDDHSCIQAGNLNELQRLMSQQAEISIALIDVDLGDKPYDGMCIVYKLRAAEIRTPILLLVKEGDMDQEMNVSPLVNDNTVQGWHVLSSCMNEPQLIGYEQQYLRTSIDKAREKSPHDIRTLH